MAVKPEWWVLLPLKDTARGKSRIGGDPARRRELAVAMVKDTVAAALAAASVRRVIVVCQRDADATTLGGSGAELAVLPGLSLNAALAAAAAAVRDRARRSNIAALPGDLPYLRGSELGVALARSLDHRQVAVADRAGTGTTLLTAMAGVELAPRYGPDSFRRHLAAGAVELDIPIRSGLRHDVDTREDLVDSAALGAHTSGLLAQIGARTHEVVA